MFCVKCGQKLDDDAVFCTKCGAKISIKKNTVSQVSDANEVKKNTVKNKKSSSKLLMSGIVIILIAITVVAVGMFFKDKKNKNISESIMESKKEAETAETVQEETTIAETTIPETSVAEETAVEEIEETEEMLIPEELWGAETVPEWDAVYSECILQGSDSRYISESELNGFTFEQCRLARNEIYARHGRKFNDVGLQNYFNQFSWYQPTIEANEFPESLLNTYEIYNRDLILEYERKQGYK